LSEKKNELKNNCKELSKKDFEAIIMDILSKSVNYTINEVEKVQKIDSTVLYDTFNQLKTENKEQLTLENFIKEVENKKLIVFCSESSTKSICEAFFNFSIVSLEDLIYDLDMFNKQSTSLLQKLRIIFSKKSKSLSSLYQSFLNYTYELIYKVGDNKRIEKIKDFYKSCYNKIYNAQEKSVQILKDKYNSYRDWVDHSYFKEVVNYPQFMFEKLNKSRIYMHDNIYVPCKDVTIKVTRNSYNLVVKNLENVKKTSEQLLSGVKEHTSSLYTKMKDDFSKYVKIELDEKKDAIVINISKDLMIEKEKFRSLMNSILEQISLVKIKENSVYIYEKTKEKSVLVKESMISKYKEFLSLFHKLSKEEIEKEEKEESYNKEEKDKRINIEASNKEEAEWKKEN